MDEYDKTGVYPAQQEVDFIKQSAYDGLKSLGKNRFPEIKKDILKDIDYYVEFYINNEGFDKAVKIQNLMQILQMNTTLSREQIEAVIMDAMGENSKQFEKTDEEKKREAEMAMAQMAAEGKPTNPLPPDQQFQNANAPIRR